MRHVILICISLALFRSVAVARPAPLLPEADVAALANELSGETAKRNLEGLVRFHRQRGSQGFHSAAELVAEQARSYGLDDVQILQFPADGKIYYGSQRSRQAWDAKEGELTELKDGKYSKIASYAAEPIVLAEDSESADLTADLIDVGDGTLEGDYASKDVKGKVVLVAAQSGAVQDLAVGKLVSLDAFASGSPGKTQRTLSKAHAGAVTYRRLKEPRGPLAVFGYDYFADHAKSAGIAMPTLLSYEGSRGGGEEYAYEALNFADGRHSAQQIADDLSAEYGAVPVALVVEYLEALKRIGVVEN